MKNFPKGFGLSTLVLGGAISATAFAQSTPATTTAPAATSSAATTSSAQPSSTGEGSSTYATGQPLQPQSKEGFWGHMNPMARKKWVKRTVDPIRERTNELDQLQAKNANDIKDVDQRAQSGISQAMMAANTADQHAADAANRANSAQTTATGASTRTDALNGTVQNLDQYQPVTSAAVKFPKGRTTLGTQAKSELDDMATKLAGEKGYIIEVQGYSRSGVQSSQAMADSVVRYLVTEHQVPIYRIYRSGLGKANAAAAADGQQAIVNGVRVTLLHNSLATMNGSAAAATNNAPASPAAGQPTAQPVNQ
ncbi:MAG: flagellar motor protein MotB [Acidobacteriota bacterium]|nr:flagellar motor protein MotB [Acidobacteriota bacterium]